MAAEAPLISVVIPTYQRERTILRAIESVMAQTLQPSEVIVVDDGSTDRTHELVGQHPSVRLVRQPQSGSAAARNRGVQEASSPWIAFLDSDDEWEPDHLGRIGSAIARTNGEASLYFDDTFAAMDMFADGKTSLYVGSIWKLARFSVSGPEMLVTDASDWVLLPIQPIMVQSSVIRRTAYLEVGGMWPRLALRHDTHLFFRLGLGRPVCAVSGIGARMTNEGGPERLTRKVEAWSRPYWDETAALYEDVLPLAAAGTAASRMLNEQLATAHWRLARLGFREDGIRASLSPLMHTIGISPSFVPRRVWSRLVHRQ